MLAHLERPAGPAPGLRRILDDFGLTYFANGLIAFIFSATGPLAVILSVGTRGGLSQAELARQSGISERYIAQIEAGRGNVSIVLLLRLAQVIRWEPFARAAEE